MKPAMISCRATAKARVLAIASPALVIAGIWRIDGALGALGVLGIALLLFARWVGSLNLRGLDVAIEAPHRATAGVRYPLRASLMNARRWFDARHVRLHLWLPGSAEVDCECDWLAAASTMHFDRQAAAVMRCPGSAVRVALESDFPLGLFAHRREVELDHAMVVLPRPRLPRGLLAAGTRLDGNPSAGATPGSLGGELRGLRAWRAGDSPRRIAWPATMRAIARGAAPIVCENAPPGFLPQHCVILMHSFASGGELIRPERFERMLEVASGWIEHLHRHGIHATLAADFDGWVARDVSTRAAITRCRESLARARRWTKCEAHELQDAVMRHSVDGQSLILLSDMPANSWQHHLPRRTPAPLIPQY